MKNTNPTCLCIKTWINTYVPYRGHYEAIPVHENQAYNLDKFEYICRHLTYSWQILLWIDFFYEFLNLKSWDFKIASIQHS